MADKPNKLAFLSMQAPAGYVAGLGRGASGFTTRADIGPARLAASSSKKTEGDDADGAADNDDDDGPGQEAEAQFEDPENETGLFAGAVYEKDDEEADRIWEAVDARMDQRRKKFRDAREREEREKARAEKPQIQAQFADLKRGLSAVTEDEWASLTESGSVTGKRRKAAAKREARNTRSFAISDTILVGNRDKNAVESALTSDQMADAEDAGGTITSLSEIGEARNKIFSHQLDAASSSSGTATSIDPAGYLTSLSSTAIKTSAEIGDIKKARSLLDSVIKTNPSHAPGWIAAARVEEVAGKLSNARKIIQQGCDHCPRSEDIWLEAARLNTNENAKVILARSIQHVSQSVNIWLKATELEIDTESKKRVLRKSLEYIPNSVKLWKELVNLEENPQDARILLSGAVAAVPMSIDLWLALARLSSPEDAKKVLNEARKTIPTSHEIWIAAARLLEETEGDDVKVDKTVAAAVRALRKAGAELSRDQWFAEAEKVEKEGSPMVCSAIIKATIEQDVEVEDRRAVWVEDAQSALERGCIEAARTILAYTLGVFPDRPTIWTQAVALEKQHGSPDSMAALLERAVTNCPKAEDLWLTYASVKSEALDLTGARQVLIRAFDANIGSEKISLAAAKLESESGQAMAAGKLLERARVEVNTPRVWLKSAVFERDHGSPNTALTLVDQALAKFSTFDKLYMLGAQLCRLKGDDKQARDYLSRGTRACPTSSPLWILSARLEASLSLIIRSRAILERARMHNPSSPTIWHESITTELAASNAAQAKALLARALQVLPASGLIWSLAIALEPRPGRKTRMADALKKTGDDSYVLSTVAQQFWLEGKVAQARKWFARATSADGSVGDHWAMWYRFEQQHGDEEARQAVEKGAERTRLRYGLVWPAIAKDPANRGKSVVEVLHLVAKQVVPLK
ncbi:PRP1 splicing factor, N-terminal [Kalmanozyma brasiliensis GHG001]|uniref:Putative pre-mRNA splicing factor prp1 n=1 Tax=Kalmanozyma brasiliensis (strain GHG001) TaxID=1365824 RepID=V5ES95_KALBG|nr:PRP1 splicing factor, N-terminal [Kalmanozyma brasiliensis GHG001]EST05808.1 PRP1 splicing factor, N-terminal [Kalmanozyma brasiliensis GHG001]